MGKKQKDRQKMKRSEKRRAKRKIKRKAAAEATFRRLNGGSFVRNKLLRSALPLLAFSAAVAQP